MLSSLALSGTLEIIKSSNSFIGRKLQVGVGFLFHVTSGGSLGHPEDG